MTYGIQDYSKLLGIKGFSDNLLNNHFTLYQGYVKNLNRLIETIATLSKGGKSDTPEYAELQRRFGFEWNGMRLHEYYFDNLGGTVSPFPEANSHRPWPQPGAAARHGKRISGQSARCAA